MFPTLPATGQSVNLGAAGEWLGLRIVCILPCSPVARGRRPKLGGSSGEPILVSWAFRSNPHSHRSIDPGRRRLRIQERRRAARETKLEQEQTEKTELTVCLVSGVVCCSFTFRLFHAAGIRGLVREEECVLREGAADKGDRKLSLKVARPRCRFGLVCTNGGAHKKPPAGTEAGSRGDIKSNWSSDS